MNILPQTDARVYIYSRGYFFETIKFVPRVPGEIAFQAPRLSFLSVVTNKKINLKVGFVTITGSCVE